MKTIYVDVYFLINFSVDLLSLHLASRFTKIPISAVRLIIASLIGGLYAVILVFLPENPIIFLLLSTLCAAMMIICCTKRCAILRKIKFLIAFLLFEITIGGLVYFSYGILDKIMVNSDLENGGTDRNLLILSLVVLLSIAVLKIFISMFSTTFSEKNATIDIKLFKESYSVEAFVDSGNLLKDPLDLSSVMLINKNTAEKIFSGRIPSISDSQGLSDALRGRFRIIPMNTSAGKRTLVGFKADSVSVVRKKGREDINVTIAIDEEGGSYGGFDALISLAALDNIK